MRLTISLPNTNRFLTAVFLVLLAVVPIFFTVEGKNFLLIGFSVLGILILTAINFRSFTPLRSHLELFMFIYMMLSSILNKSNSQFSSLAYSSFFIGSYVFYSSWAKRDFDLVYFRRLLKIIFILYFIGLLAGQVYVAAGLFTPIEGISGFLKGYFGTTLENDGFRYYSLSSEPSYASFIVILLYYSYMLLDKSKGSLFKGENLFLFILLVYMVIFFKSGYGIVLFGILLASYFGLSKTSIAVYGSILILTFLFFVFGKQLFRDVNYVPVQRVLNVIDRFDLSNPISLFQADFNTYFRIVPIFYYFETASVNDWQFYLGHGASTSKEFIVPAIFTAYLDGEYLGGFLPAFLYDYGIVGAFLVITFIARLLPGIISISTVIVILLLTNANFNTQLFWFIIFCLTLNKHFLQQNYKHEVIS